MKILLPVDGSSFSRRAAIYVAQHLQLFGRRSVVTLVHVDPPLLERLGVQISPEDIAQFHEKNSDAALRASKKVLADARISYRERRLVGDPGVRIAEVAKKERPDLIVMGSHGRGALKSLFLGSVVTKTLAQTRVPILVVR